MTAPPGRRERKKAATRQKIADTALRLFLERGYDAVGIRDVAAEADVAVTTVFAHFDSKEALVFERDADFEHRLVRAVAERGRDDLVPALRHEVHAIVRHCTTGRSAALGELIQSSPDLRGYNEAMCARHAASLATAIAAELGLPPRTTACRAIARFAVDAHVLAREAQDPEAAVDEVFRMIQAAWDAADLSADLRADPHADLSAGAPQDR